MVIPQVLLLAREGMVRQKFEDEIKRFGVRVDTVSSFRELYSLLKTIPYNGVMVDLLVKLKSPEQDKSPLMDVLENFPVLLLNYEKHTDAIRSFYFSQFKGNTSLENFINRECRAFKARVARSDSRKRMSLNALLTKGDDPDRIIEKTVTIDISSGGCFLFSVLAWEMNSEVGLILKELSDQTPIVCEVRWKREWGEAMQIPGIGLKFKRINENQLQEIRALL